MSTYAGLPVVTDTAKFPHWEDGVLIYGRSPVKVTEIYVSHLCPSCGSSWRYGTANECPDCSGETFEFGSGI